MIAAPPPVRLAELMRRFDYRDADSFRAYRQRLEAMGFPKPLPGATRPLKWSREQVDDWFACGGRPADAALRNQSPGGRPAQRALNQTPPNQTTGAPSDPAPEADEIAASQARLRARLAAQQHARGGR